MIPQPLVELQDLSVTFTTHKAEIAVVRGVNLVIPTGKTVCLVGESGCGKSVTAKSILRVIEHPGRIASGSIRLLRDGGELLDIAALKPNDERLRAIRGGEIAMIHQEPMAFLSPLYTIGNQIVEALRLHRKVGKREARELALDMLRQVGMPDPEKRIDAYTFQLSGGQRQRAMIAMALVAEPRLLIADEPTTALDVTTQASVLELLGALKRERDMSMLFITHDLGVVEEIADEIAVMYLGEIVEQGTVDEVLSRPRHPYTRGLLASMPRLDRDFRRPLQAIPGMVPPPVARPSGCAFHTRCTAMLPGICDAMPVGLTDAGGSHRVACHAYGPHAAAFDLDRDLAPRAAEVAVLPSRGEPRTLLQVRRLAKHFPIRAGFLERVVGHVRAVDDVSFDVREGETLGLVGESGCGKSTLGQSIVGLHKADNGAVTFTPSGWNGIDALAAKGADAARLRRGIRMVFQDPTGSLNPRMRVRDIIGEVLQVEGQLSDDERTARVRELLGQVGLSPDYDTRYPHAFSGGQRQRIAIARALASNPRLVIADEAVSALDVSVQTQIINLMKQLQVQLGLTYIFISHDLGVVANISDRVAVMFAGRIVEMGDTETIFRAPAHPYTEALLSAIPGLRKSGRRGTGLVEAAGAAAGCPFVSRCPHGVARCRVERPELLPARTGQHVACHRAGELELASPLPKSA